MSLSSRRTRQNYDELGVDPITALVDTFFSKDRTDRMFAWPGDIKVDASETKDAFFISADLPGVHKDNIKVSLDKDRNLTIQAERSEEHFSSTDANCTLPAGRLRERTFGKISRSFRLPKGTNTDDCVCKYDNGVLDIRVGKKDPSSDVNYISIE